MMNTKNTMLATLLLSTALVNTTSCTGGLNKKKVTKLTNRITYAGKILTGAAAGGTMGVLSGAVAGGVIGWNYGNQHDPVLAALATATLGAIIIGAIGGTAGAVITDLFISDEPAEENKVDVKSTN